MNEEDAEQKAIDALVTSNNKERTREFLEALDLKYGNAPEPKQSARQQGRKK